MSLVAGVGINDESIPTRVDGNQTREYKLWHSMINRCYSPVSHEKKPTYIGCFVSESFKHFHLFHNWVGKQIGFTTTSGSGAWNLDKDILVKNNKVYSESTCVFVPQCINKLLVKCDAARGVHPVGTSWNKKTGSYKASCRVGGVQQHLGLYSTPEAAFAAYKIAKEAEIKRMANEYKHLLDPRVFDALMYYQVDIDD